MESAAPPTHKIDPRRAKVRELFEQHLAGYYASEPPDVAGEQTRARARELERACYNVLIEWSGREMVERRWTNDVFAEEYAAHVAILVQYIDLRGSIVQKYGRCAPVAEFINGDIKAAELAHMPEHDLCPVALRTERDIIQRRRAQVVTKKGSTLYACPNCKQRNIEIRTSQLRAGDEASDEMCECNECHHKFIKRA